MPLAWIAYSQSLIPTVYALFNTSPSPAPFFLRAVLVAVFLFHGGQKSFGWFEGAGWHASMEAMVNFGIPAVLAMTTIVLEIAIVPLLFLGFLTRLAALIGCGLIAGSLYFVNGGSSFPDLQIPLLVLACSLALLFQGGGGLSLDHRISRALLPPLRSGGLRLT